MKSLKRKVLLTIAILILAYVILGILYQSNKRTSIPEEPVVLDEVSPTPSAPISLDGLSIDLVEDVCSMMAGDQELHGINFTLNYELPSVDYQDEKIYFEIIYPEALFHMLGMNKHTSTEYTPGVTQNLTGFYTYAVYGNTSKESLIDLLNAPTTFTVNAYLDGEVVQTFEVESQLREVR